MATPKPKRHLGPPSAGAQDDPTVYSGRSGRGLSPYALFLIATFWLAITGGITLFFSVVWGCVILGVAAITLIAALLTAG